MRGQQTAFQFRLFRILTAIIVTGILVYLWGQPAQAEPAQTETISPAHQEGELLSPFWEPVILQWSSYISILADAHGLDPDFIAAVIKEESNGKGRAWNGDRQRMN